MKRFYTYVIFSQNTGKYYIGYTSNLEKRISEHNNGKTTYTRNKGPWVLVHSVELSSKSDAIRIEKLIKSYKGGNAFKKMIKSNS